MSNRLKKTNSLMLHSGLKTKGFLLSLLAGTVLYGAIAPTAYTATPAKAAVVASAPRIVGAEATSEKVKDILAVMHDLQKSSNAHDLEGVLNHYSGRFISGDNLNLEHIRSLIEETWSLYPDIHYQTELIEIRLSGNWATVESLDIAHATAKAEADMATKDNGVMESRSRGLLYLHQVGGKWEVFSDYTLYEEARVSFGKTIGLPVKLTAPEQVFSGETYSAELDASFPEGMFAVASISKDPLIFPQPKPREKFRTLTPDKMDLERVFEANTANRNEIVTAIIGVTQIGQEEDSERPMVLINGIATLVKRVNVVSRATQEVPDAEALVRYSADGNVDLRKGNADIKRLEGESQKLEE